MTDTIIKTLDLARYNGTVTVYNTVKGTHRTFRIRTQRGGKWKGSRKVGYLFGPDNTSDYKTFAYIKEGEVLPFKQYEDSAELVAFCKVLNYPEHYQKLGCEYHFSVRCRVCNRELTDPVSIKLGIGPICRGDH